jgi:hypothetical protein
MKLVLTKGMKAGIILFVLVVAVLGSGFTYIYFNDTNNDPFSPATHVLEIGNQATSGETISEHIAIANIKPGDRGNAANWSVRNTGTGAGNLSISLSEIINKENDLTPDEKLAGNTTIELDEGELGANLLIVFWMDVDGNGKWSEKDYYLVPGGRMQTRDNGETVPDNAYQPLNTYGNTTWDALEFLSPGFNGNNMVEYLLPEETGNTVQSDSCLFDISFILQQV